MGIDIANLVWRNSSVTQRVTHALGTAAAVLGRCCHVKGITAHAEADQFCIYGGAARPGLLVLFKHHSA